MLSISGLDVAYGQSQVLWGVDLEVRAGELLCLMGRNGVGKTTLLKTAIGLLPARGGRVMFDGADITSWSPDRRARAGVGYVPQGREIFPHLSVEGNLRMALLGCGPAPSPHEPLAPFPPPQPPLARHRRVPPRRRAADARGRAPVTHQAEASDARRANRGHPALDHPRDRGSAPPNQSRAEASRALGRTVS